MGTFFATYRWELWLVLWAPLLSGIASVLPLALLGLLYGEGHMVPRHAVYAQGAVTSLVHAGLLLVFYARVRRLGRRFLTLVWGYALWLATVGALVGLAAVVLMPDPDSSEFSTLSLWWRGRFLAHGLAALPLLFWFARRASLLSLAHAYFLFLILKAYSLMTVISTVLNLWIFHLVPVGLLMAITFAFLFGFGSLVAWLLGNFESRGPRLRRLAVGLLLAAYAMSVVWSPSGVTALLQDRLTFAQFLVGLVLPLVLIYLVRVRGPAGQEPRTGLRVQ